MSQYLFLSISTVSQLTIVVLLCLKTKQRAYPGNWEALLEKPDGSTEVLQTYKTKPSLREVSELVREESFKRYAVNNDRWMSGRM